MENGGEKTAELRRRWKEEQKLKSAAAKSIPPRRDARESCRRPAEMQENHAAVRRDTKNHALTPPKCKRVMPPPRDGTKRSAALGALYSVSKKRSPHT